MTSLANSPIGVCIAGYCLNVGLKLLGNTLSNDLTWKRHVDNSVKKAGKIIYILYQIKRTGVNQADLGRSIHKCREPVVCLPRVAH